MSSKISSGEFIRSVANVISLYLNAHCCECLILQFSHNYVLSCSVQIYQLVYILILFNLQAINRADELMLVCENRIQDNPRAQSLICRDRILSNGSSFSTSLLIHNFDHYQGFLD